MDCMHCGFTQTICVDSRPSGSLRRRRYECLACGKRTTTYEGSVDDLVLFVSEKIKSRKKIKSFQK